MEWIGGDTVICGRWKIDGRRWEGCGRHICRPYGVTGTGRRRGQDPSLQCGVEWDIKQKTGAYARLRAAYMPPLLSEWLD